MEKPLIVIGPQCMQSVLRNVHKRCHPPELAGVHNGRALLVRDDKLIAHDLRSGKETLLLDLGPVGSSRATGIDGKI
ncbi:hypothetical protein [Catelliglobosispora koreensis]|uniref:hypothetical protein n=1 Tax=Catelliglobosispora koreensis TaxID=129052 RepID=UPI00037209C5|nr:hypothetical protein [Catelliglobosispora koreensis]